MHADRESAFWHSYQRALFAIVIITIVLSCCTSCSIEPLIYQDARGRDVASLGASLFTKSATKDLSITRPDGTVITSRTVGLDETKTASIWGNLKLFNAATPVLKGAGDALQGTSNP